MTVAENQAIPSHGLEQEKGDRAPLHRRGWLVAAIAAIAIAAVALTWFLAFSPQESTIRLAPLTNVGLDEDIVVSGSVLPAEPSRDVRLSLAASADGPWLSGPTALTDSEGNFAVPVPTVKAGELWVRATALPHGRSEEASSRPESALVRAPSKITLETSTPVVPTTKIVLLGGSASPTGGAVTLEQSTDGAVWDAVSASVVIGDEGAFSAQVKGLEGGSWQFRAIVAETDAATAATSSAVTVRVEDYKAAGAQYLKIIKPFNEATNANNDAIDAYNANSTEARLKAIRRTDSALSTASGNAAKEFRAYKGWPESISGSIEALAKTHVLEADALNLMSKTTTVDERNDLYPQFIDANTEGGKYAAEIREALGLPKRK